MKYRPLFFATGLLMFMLGICDSLKGVFTPLFTSFYGLSAAELGMLLSATYLGCLIVPIVGGAILDRFGIRKALSSLLLVIAAACLLLMVSTGFMTLAAGLFLSVGLNTLLNTTVTMYAGRFGEKNSMMWVNLVFVLQGVGMSGAQFLLSFVSGDRSAWQVVTLAHVLVFVPIAFFMMKARGLSDSDASPSETAVSRCVKADWFSVAAVAVTLSCYLIAEHGTFNYFLVYGMQGLGLTSSRAGLFLSLYTVGIMTGRLVWSPLVQKLGTGRFICLSLILSFAFSIPIYIFGLPYFTILMGLASAIVYPTCVAVVKEYVPKSITGRATTLVISTAGFADIIFNMVFGHLSDRFGYAPIMFILTLFFLLGAVCSIPLFRKKAA